MDLKSRRLLLSQRLLPACDQCYAKKTRCDRLNPCAGCVINGVDCLRRRPRTSARKRNRSQTNRVDDVMSRVMRLEETLLNTGQRKLSSFSTRQTTPGREDRSSQANSPDSEIDELTELQSHHLKSTSLGTRITPEADRAQPFNLADDQAVELKPFVGENSLSPESEEIASIDLQRYLRSCPQSKHALDADRRNALESTIDSAKRLAISGLGLGEVGTVSDRKTNFYDPSMYPSPELLHLMLAGAFAKASTAYFLDFYTNVSPTELEKMAFALQHCTVHGQRRLQYVICVNYLAFAFLNTLESDQSEAMREHLAGLKAKHQDNIQAALNQLDVRVRAELPLLQSLLSGAMLMQAMGKTRRCWQLNNAACRVSIALSNGSRLLDMEATMAPEDYFQMRFSFMKCYIFDVALSASLYLPPAGMAHMDFAPEILDPKRPSHAMMSVLLKCSAAHESMVRETRAFNELGHLKKINVERLKDLKDQMVQIRAVMDEFRAEGPHCDDDYISYEWMCMDLWFHSMMTSVIRLSGTHGDPMVHRESLQYARNALRVLKHVLDKASRSLPSLDKYVICLAWFVPLFPLQPLYILFSNIISTSDLSGLKLIQDVCKLLENLAKTHPSIMAVRQICKSLLQLYSEFTQKLACSTMNFEGHFGTADAALGLFQHDPSFGDTSSRERRLTQRLEQPPRFTVDFTGDALHTSYRPAQIESIPDTSNSAQDFDWERFCAQASLPTMDFDFLS